MIDTDRLDIYVNRDTGTIMVANPAFNEKCPFAVDFAVYSATSGGTTPFRYPCFGRDLDYDSPWKGDRDE